MNKYIYILASALVVVGCGSDTDTRVIDVYEEENTQIIEAQIPANLKTQRQGQTCGQDIGMCLDGLVCARPEGSTEPLTCMIADQNPDLTCDDAEVNYVCAEKEGILRTYQNSCLARKANAGILFGGDCTKGLKAQ